MLIVCLSICNLRLCAQDSLSVKNESTLDTISATHQQSSQPKFVKNANYKYTIEGLVKDFTTDEPLSFATITFVGKAKGVKADVNGKFFFEANELPSDSIAISSIGYKKIIIPVDKKTGYRFYKIEMERSSVQMKNFVMHVSKDPALSLIKKVIKHKPQNNYNKADNYSYEVYNKLEMDINKIPKKSFSVSPLLKNFSFIQNFIDSTSDEKPFLPLFLTETISDYYYQQKPKKMKELIKGSRISGYKNQSVSQMLGAMYQNITIYDNQIPVFDVLFTSPIADDAPFFYKYQISDTQYVNDKRFFQVVFTPKRKGEHTFEGDIWIHDSDYAVQKVNMILGKEQNINWVNKITMMQEFTCLHDSIWFLTRDKFYVDFLPPHGDKVAGFLGRKTSTYKNIIINDQHNVEVLNDKHQKSETDFQKDALNRDENYWNEVRHDTLSKNEKSIYKMIDTIQGLPIYKKYYSGFYLLATGIKEIGPLEIGPIYNLYSKNSVEGARWRFTLGTTPKLFKNIYMQAYLAYGSKDQRFKYYGSALWLLQRKPRMYIYAEYKHDIDNAVNSYDDAGSIDNIFGAIGRKKVPWKLAFTDYQRIEFYKSYFNGFSYKFFAEKKIFTPYAPLPYEGIFYANDSMNTNSVLSNEIGLELRFAYREKFVEGNYYRSSLGTDFPIIKAFISKGFKNILKGEYNYTKLRFTISDTKKLNHFGSIHYNIFLGKVFGTLPYSLLEVHPGNEFYYYNSRAFNMMYRYEYVSDTYVGASLEHSMGTLFFKYIPYIKKMKLRTFWNAKGVYGSLSSANQNLNLNRGYTFQTLVKSPYLEVGTGIENIFKVLRIDFVWRLLPTENLHESDLRRFGIFGSMKFAF